MLLLFRGRGDVLGLLAYLRDPSRQGHCLCSPWKGGVEGAIITTPFVLSQENRLV